MDIPCLVLLLREPRRVAVDELARVVNAELGEPAAATVGWVGANSAGGSYLEWRCGAIVQRLGTFDQPYWQMNEEPSPEALEHREAWISHRAWLYVDALNMARDGRDHRSVVMRIASWLVDKRCVLLWLAAGGHKRVCLPASQTVGALREGRWPG